MSFWDSILKVALPAATTIYGSYQTQKSSAKAAQQAVNAQNAATQAQVSGLNQTQQTLQANQDAAAPGLLRTQEVISRGSTLTPEQEQAVEDSRRQSLNALQGSSLRGSGRATSAIVSDVDRRTRNAFMDQNRNAADSAAAGLTNQYFNAGNNIAGTSAQKGTAVSTGLLNTGSVNAANTLGQGASRGQVIGDIGAIISDQAKQKSNEKRESSYINWNDGTQTLYNQSI